jgi:NAD(P)-dependent dehydrogenase (short-subunit alcohol dehydrogenase family)
MHIQSDSDPQQNVLPLTGRVALVTGASSGLGRHFSTVLARAGASVALAARRVDRLETEVAAIRTAGGKAIAVRLDVTDAEAIGPAVNEVQQQLGPLSILVNNAGVSGAGLALDLTPEQWDATYAVNVRGVFLAAQAAARAMIADGEAERGHARIVNIVSIASFSVLNGMPAYCSSKAACAMLTKSLAREWAKNEIAVNAICPGFIRTEINSRWFETENGERQIRAFPRRRLMEMSDLNAALLMLVGPAARAVTGTLITLDDGQTL